MSLKQQDNFYWPFPRVSDGRRLLSYAVDPAETAYCRAKSPNSSSRSTLVLSTRYLVRNCSAINSLLVNVRCLEVPGLYNRKRRRVHVPTERSIHRSTVSALILASSCSSHASVRQAFPSCSFEHVRCFSMFAGAGSNASPRDTVMPLV